MMKRSAFQSLVVSFFCVSAAACSHNATSVKEPVASSNAAAAAPADAKQAFTVEPGTGKIDFKADIVYFSFDEATLTPEGKQRLDALATYLKANPNVNLQVEGNADARGTPEYNLALGERRAAAVKDYLTTIGIDGKRLATISFGSERPAVEGSGEDAWSKNRRVEFYVKTDKPAS